MDTTVVTRQPLREVSLDDRYLLEEGTVYLRGIQALVRFPLDASHRDRRAGLRIGTFISGYPGAPLAGYDLALQQIRPLLEQHDIVHVPATNEDLAATAIMGTQMLDAHPHARYDGVTAIWYGKGPGVDRSGDALKHGNFAGTSRHGAVVLLAGEDHEAKSSSFPFQDDYAFMSAGIPVLYPASVREFLDHGIHAVHLSRFSGCWVALKLVAALADGNETIEVSPDRPAVVVPQVEIDGRPFRKVADFAFFGTKNIELERHLYYERHRAVVEYARANRLDRVEVDPPDARLGIVTAGKSYADMRQALLDLGLDDEALRRCGIRLLRVGLIYPVDRRAIREFARGLREVVVVEEKRGFLEAQVKEALCGQPVAVVGKFDDTGRPLFPIQGGMDSDLIAERLAERLRPYVGDHPPMHRRLAVVQAIRARRYDAHPARTPNYCSGCPHNVSTLLLPDMVASGSPGCHSFASLIDQPQRRIVAMTQYGGEGAPWVGLLPFTDRTHLVANMGDGSFFHSGSLSIRFAAAVGAHVTFKILYNGAIANTGAQRPVGGKPVADLTRLLAAEGVRAIALVTKQPAAYRRAALAPITRVYHVDRLEEALQRLREVPGTTVMIYDEMCANERRRLQKRGRLPAPTRFVFINEDVCENCGHCGSLTNCMSLQKVDTEFGPKTQVHQASCNTDYRCLGGDCPSFVTVDSPAGLRRPQPPHLEADAVPEPARRVGLEEPYHIYIPGVGGTGVITINALLGYAALMDGRYVMGYDQTGAAQKWGPVLSSLIIAPQAGAVAASKVGAGKADLYLVLDILGGIAPANLDRCDPERTVAVVNRTLFPTGEVIRNAWYTVDVDGMVATVERYTRVAANVVVDGRQLAEALFGDHMATNPFMLGVAYQHGLLPLSAASLEAAIRLNGVQVEQNLQAFRYGRLFAADPARVLALVERRRRPADEEQAAQAVRLGGARARAYAALLARCVHFDEESRRMLAVRVAELIDYQNMAYATRYVDAVLQVAAREQAARPGAVAITRAVIASLYKLMAYKDEYEVARLYLEPAFGQRLRETFADPRRVVFHFHPPLLRALGLRHKLAVGPWVRPLLRLLRALRGVRGTPLDLFGYAALRREERALVGWYLELLDRALAALRPETYDLVLQVARLPDGIRGYEGIKRTALATVRRQAAELLDRLADQAVPA
ncbi:MAG: indolepyruvate ferredoxin oxidoreductase family protein [Armatimonadota bacterium]|nr:indolepyruvate ferredoxin oxidoreductase family protein [Armatimonadota bacterium]MDR7537595.1 indolepyruvate ferredoxin oxidoreductase family protein [Armatimonadota bacterium]